MMTSITNSAMLLRSFSKRQKHLYGDLKEEVRKIYDKYFITKNWKDKEILLKEILVNVLKEKGITRIVAIDKCKYGIWPINEVRMSLLMRAIGRELEVSMSYPANIYIFL